MNRRNLVAVTLCAAVLAGCATAPGPTFKGLDTVATGSANVYVYRKSALFASGQSFKIDLNDKAVGEIFNASYLLLQVPPGAQTVTVKPGGFAKDFSYSLTAEAGKTHFVEFDFNGGLLGNAFFLGAKVVERQQGPAMKDLAELKSAK